jgi:ribonuclease HI
MIEIYTDGSCKPTNPGPAGYGVVVITDGVITHYCSSFIGEATNNVAEISGIDYSLDYLDEIDKSWDDVVIYTDSNYCVGLFTKNWNAKKNKELVKKVRDKLERFPNLNIKWVKGHVGDEYNEVADRLAGDAVVSMSTTKGINPND